MYIHVYSGSGLQFTDSTEFTFQSQPSPHVTKMHRSLGGNIPQVTDRHM